MKKPRRDIPLRTRDIDLVIQECGLKAAKKLIEKMGSMRLYIPSLKNAFAEAKKKYVLKNFDGGNHRELAKKTGFSIRWVYKILKD